MLGRSPALDLSKAPLLWRCIQQQQLKIPNALQKLSGILCLLKSSSLVIYSESINIAIPKTKNIPQHDNPPSNTSKVSLCLGFWNKSTLEYLLSIIWSYNAHITITKQAHNPNQYFFIKITLLCY